MKLLYFSLILLCNLVIADFMSDAVLSEQKERHAAAGGGGRISFAGGENSDVGSSSVDSFYVGMGYQTASTIKSECYDLAGAYADNLISFGGGRLSSAVYTDELNVHNISGGTDFMLFLSVKRADLAAAGKGQRILYGGGYNGTSHQDVVDVLFTNNGSLWSTNFPSGVKRSHLAAAAAGNVILFAGGSNGTQTTDIVDIYDVVTDEWMAPAYLSQSRTHLMGAGSGGIVIFAGGRDLSYYPSSVVDIFDVVTGIWNISSLSVGRYDGAASGDENGLIFIGGGLNAEFSARLDIYDTNIQSWHVARINRAFNNAAASSGNVTIFAGGRSPSGEIRSATKIATNANCRARRTISVRTNQSFLGEILLFMGGLGGTLDAPITYGRVDIYIVATGSWQGHPVDVPRREASLAYANNKLYFGGGQLLDNSTASTYLETYDYSTDTRGSNSLSVPRTKAAATAIGLYILFAGGYPLDPSMDIFNSISDSRTVIFFEHPRYHLAAASTTTHAYFAGGRDENSALAYVDRYSLSLTHSNDSLVTARFNLAGIGLNDVAFFAGGENEAGNIYNVIDVFNDTSDTHWTMYLQFARTQLAIAGSEAHNMSYVVFGGGRNETSPLDTVEMYNISTCQWKIAYLSVASYGLSAIATESGDLVIFMAGTTFNGSHSCAMETFKHIHIDGPDICGLYSSSSSSSLISSGSASNSSSSDTSVSSSGAYSSASSGSSAFSGSSASSSGSSVISSYSSESSSKASPPDILFSCLGNPLCILLSVGGTAAVIVILVVIVIIVFVIIIIVVILVLISINFVGISYLTRKKVDERLEQEMEYVDEVYDNQSTEYSGNDDLFAPSTQFTDEMNEIVAVTQHPTPILDDNITDSKSPFLDRDPVIIPPAIDDE